MTRRWAGTVLALAACAAVAGTFLLPPTAGVEALFTRLFGLAFAAVGFLACGAPKGRRMGWLCLAIGASAVGFDVLLGYAQAGGAGALWAGWGGNVLSQPQPVLAVILLPALFPTGEVLGPRWRWLPPVALVLLTLMVVAAAADPGPILVGSEIFRTNPYPVEVPALVHRPTPFPLSLPEGIHDLLFLSTAAIGAVAVPAALLSMILRFRRSRGVERQQLRWLVAGLVAAVATMTGILLGFSVGLEDGPVVDAAFGVVSLALPAAIGVALTRHRLYDLDRLVSRTLAYTLVAVSVLAAYLTLVVVLGAGARALTGEEGDLVVALSTLAAAALFQPLRRRVASLVDRRFDRARYDAERITDEFARGLRDELGLRAVVDQLRDVTAATVRPQAIGVVLVAGRR